MLHPNSEIRNPKFKYLIVNADDYNTDRERNRGIIKAAQEGIVTSVSVIANLHWEEGALETLKTTFGDRIGIHLNLTRGKPLTDDVQSLVNERGEFFNKQQAWRKALVKRFDLGEVEKECAAQITELHNRGIRPDHIDGNNHIHIFPGIVDVVTRLANRFQIEKVRLPCELFTTGRQYFQAHALKKIFINSLAQWAQRFLKHQRLMFADRCAGVQFPDVKNLASLKFFISSLPEGTTELMCHPGYRKLSGNLFSSEDREKELYCLTHKEIIEHVKRSGIRLISFNEL